MPCMWAVGETEDEREKNNQSHAQLPWTSFAAGHNPNFLRACAPHSWPQRPASAPAAVAGIRAVPESTGEPALQEEHLLPDLFRTAGAQ